MRMLLRVTEGYNLFFGLRWLLLAALCALLFITQERTLDSSDSVGDLAIAFAAGAAVTVVLWLVILVHPLRIFTPFVLMAGDWVITGSFVYLAADNALLVLSIAATVLIAGMMRLGSTFGTIDAVGVLIATFIGLSLAPSLGYEVLLESTLTYLPVGFALVLLAVTTRIWTDALDENNSRTSKEIRKTLAEQTTQLENLRERSRAVVEMTNRLNTTLDYDKILDAALGLGRLSLRTNPKQRVVSIMLLVEAPERLEIETARGLSHLDEHRTFEGKQGMLAEALEEGRPIIRPDGETDPELGRLLAFKNIQSVLIIPLKYQYDIFGALVYGSTDPHAFNVDLIDTLASIGTQATIALQNAVLYTTLREEKERIIEIEENARKALVRDLHDVPTQTISAVTMRMGVIPIMLKKAPEQIDAEIEEIRQLSQRATDEIRHVMFTLRPLALETQGLEAALKQLVDKVKKTYNQRVTLNVRNQATQLLETKQQDMLFYLIEEAVNNARKYAQASIIRVTVSRDENDVVVRVSDDGVGFDLKAVNTQYENRGSFGMVNMRERAELIGGTFELESAPGQGTTVTVCVPIPESKRRTSGETIPISPLKRLMPPRKQKKQYSGPLSPSE
jgi:signal transduction histidine kinase